MMGSRPRLRYACPVDLLFQVAGVALAAAALVLGVRQFMPAGRPALAVVAVIPVIVISLNAVPSLRGAVRSFKDQRAVNSKLDRDTAAVRGGAALGVDVDFLAWVRRRLEPGDTFQVLVEDDAVYPQVYQWSSFQLAPNLLAESAGEADWIVLFGSPGRAELPGGSYAKPELYGPERALIRRSDAG